MIMTEMEMATVYRQAKDKKKQIKILMELNGLRESEVRDILFRNGIKQNEMPRNRSHKQEEMDRLVAESVPEELSASEPESLPVLPPPPKISTSVLDSVEWEEAQVQEEYADLCERVEGLNREMARVSSLLADIQTAKAALIRYYGKEQHNGSI